MRPARTTSIGHPVQPGSRPGRGDLPRHPGQVAVITALAGVERGDQRRELISGTLGAQLRYVGYSAVSELQAIRLASPDVNGGESDFAQHAVPAVTLTPTPHRGRSVLFRDIETPEVQVNERVEVVQISALESIWQVSSTIQGMGEFQAGILRSIKEDQRACGLRTQPRAQRRHPRIFPGSTHELDLRELVKLQGVIGDAVLPVHDRGVLRRPNHPEVITYSGGQKAWADKVGKIESSLVLAGRI